ncbi:Sortase family protein [Thermomonospora echinospora]|uniref:Sortase family protein n=1 Tax=Thermomonospora echinospora TaxID=1992 RepID=A0A1H5TEI5_9ACTN|nr:class F sortase [Thermomonospora echinospora]SEF61226.1 Sortase family protein [Thermomonospora echinospora]
MARPKNAEYLAAVVLAVTAAVAWGHGSPEDQRTGQVHDGPRALWHIPDGEAMPASAPVRLEIPRLGVRAPVLPVGRNRDGTVEVPPLHRPRHVGWYRHGPAPGSRGAAVLLGHYDDLRGPAVFYRLGEVRPGDVVRVVRRDRSVAVFAVDATEQVPKEGFPGRRVYGPVRYAGLRLVTCGGTFDHARRSYSDNVVVYAHLTGRERIRR